MKKLSLLCTTLILLTVTLNTNLIRGVMGWLNTPVTTRAEISGKDGALTVTAPNTIINKYTVLAVDAPAGASMIAVTNPGGPNGLDNATLTPGDLIMIIQLAGAEINTSDSPQYGMVTDLRNAGRYEFVTVSSVDGNLIKINPPCGGLRYSYSASGKTQVVRVPQYTSLTISNGGSLTAPAWNGKYGGIVVAHVQSDAIINGVIDVSGLGYRGGAMGFGGGGFRSDYVTTQQDFGAEKGEGFAGYQMDYDLKGGRYGRGAAANGGGGGTSHTSGGGGGANGNNGKTWSGQGVMDGTVTGAAAWQKDPGYIANGNALTDSSGGGRGGYSYAVNNGDALVDGPGSTVWGGDNRREVGGLGGRPAPQDTSGRIFFGGGGGAGTQNNDSGGAGGSGGGLIYIIANNVSGTGQLRANGNPGGNTHGESRDAAGGAGAGGTIVVSSKGLSGISAQANGGAGGIQIPPAPIFPDESEGPGGGGGGGFIAYTGGSISAQVNAGANGISQSPGITEFPANGATRGATGVISTVISSIPFCSTNSDIAVTKTNNATTVTPGAQTTYTIVVKNNGPNDVFGIPVSDPIPSIFTNVTWTCSSSVGSSCLATSGTGNINTRVNLLNGGTATFVVLATPNPSTPAGSVTNTVTITPPEGAIDTNPDNNTASDTDSITPQADLSITKTDGVTEVTAGTAVTYTLLVRNNGPSAVTGATVSDPLSAKHGSASWTCVASAGGSCAASSGTGAVNTTVNLLPNATATFTITTSVLPNATGSLVNTATVTSPGGVPDPSTGNNSATDTDTITATGDLSITKTNNATMLVPGSQTTYTIVASNAGPSAITGASVVDNIPANLTNATWTCLATAGSSCAVNNGSGNINTTVNLLNGGSATFTVTATVSNSATGTLTNTATITPPPTATDPNPGNNSASDSDPLQPTADLSIIKTATPNPVRASENLTFTIKVTNNGPSSATGVTVTDALVDGLTLVSATSTVGSCSGTKAITCAIGTLDAVAPNNVATITIVATVAGNYPPGPLANTAVVSSSTVDPNTSNNSSTTTVTVTPPPGAKFRPADIAIRTSGVDVCIGGGNVLNVEVKLTNSGTGKQKDNPGSEFTAELPTQLSAILGSCSASKGTCVAVNNQIDWNGEINTGETVTITYQVRVRQFVQVGQRFCTDFRVNYDTDNDGLNDITTSAQSCQTANCTPAPCTGPDCPDLGPGTSLPDNPSVVSSDTIPGSILIFPIYTSDVTSPNSQNTRISITNVDVSRPAYVHLFFVDGNTCSVADSYLCLTPVQTASFLMSDLDPGISGYIIAMAVDSQGCPMKFNYLIGDEYVKFSSGHAANLGAEAVAAINVPTCSTTEPTTSVNLDGVQYSLLGRVVVADGLPSAADGNSPLLVLDRIGGNLAGSTTTIGSLFGLLYNDTEIGYSFTATLGTCQLRTPLNQNFPRSAPRYPDVVPSGHSGWMKLWLNTTSNDAALVGSIINLSSNVNGYQGGRNLHKLTLAPTSLTIPLFPPSCQ
jgi:uncharacterized repeat protein (TIGR01451 family)